MVCARTVYRRFVRRQFVDDVESDRSEGELRGAGQAGLGWLPRGKPGLLLLGFAGVLGLVALGAAARELGPTRLVAADPTCAEATVTWTGSMDDTLWSSADNWIPSRVPTPIDIVCVKNNASVRIESSTSIGSLVVEPGSALVITRSANVDIHGTVVNSGTVSLGGGVGVSLACDTRLVNNGRFDMNVLGELQSVENVESDDDSGSSEADGDSSEDNSYPPAVTVSVSSSCDTASTTFWNTSHGVVDTVAIATLGPNIGLENDGSVTVSMGELTWVSNTASMPDDGVSAGSFSGSGGTLKIGGVTVGGSTQFGNGVVVTGGLSESGPDVPALADGVTLTVDGGTVNAPFAGPGKLSVVAGTLAGEVAGNVFIQSGGAVNLAIRPGAVVEVAGHVAIDGTLTNDGLLEVAGTVAINGTLTNDGLLRLTTYPRLYQRCDSRLVNNGRIEITPESGNSWTPMFEGLWWCSASSSPKFWNTGSGVVHSSGSVVTVSGVTAENDGSVVASGGRLKWASRSDSVVDDGVSAGSFAGPGGTLQIDGVRIGEETHFGNGVVVTGELNGSAISIPALADGVTLTVDGGRVNVPLAGPGQLLVKSGWLTGEIAGNVSIQSTGTVGLLGEDSDDGLRIRDGAVVEVAGSSHDSPLVTGKLVNDGILRLTTNVGLAQSCGARVVNNGRMEIRTEETDSPAPIFKGNRRKWCTGSPPQTFWNTSSGVLDSSGSVVTADDSPDGPVTALENDGSVIASGGHLTWASYSGWTVDDGVSSGSFSGSGGKLEIAEPGWMTIDGSTRFGNGVVISGRLNESGTGVPALPAGVTLTVDGGVVAAPFSGPGKLLIKSGSLGGEVAGNVSITSNRVWLDGPYIGGYFAGPMRIRPEAVVEITATAAAPMYNLPVGGTLTNDGTLRFRGSAGLSLDCGARIVNNGRIEFASEAGNPDSPWPMIGGTYGWGCTESSQLWNTSSGVVESAGSPVTMDDRNITAENDGSVVATAGQLTWASNTASGPDDGVSSGSFSGPGGTLKIDGATVDRSTRFGNGVIVTGALRESGTDAPTLPAGVTLTVDGGTVNAPLAGPGQLLVKSGTLTGEVSGNVSIQSAGPVRLNSYHGQSLTIRPGAVVDVSPTSTHSLVVQGRVTNNGTFRLASDSGLFQACESEFINAGSFIVPATAQLATVSGSDIFCSTNPKFINAPGGSFDSWTTGGLTFDVWLQNNGSIKVHHVAAKLSSTASWTTTHAGYFGSADGGHLALCGPFLLVEPGRVASDVGLMDRCGTVVADVTDFTPQQITDVMNAAGVAGTLASTSASGLPSCEFRGVNLVDFYGYYPDQCNYTPQQYGADAYEFYIEWMPGLGAALDLGHAIFGRDLAGRELSTSERILDGFFASFPAAVDKYALTGVERIRWRAITRGADEGCNSFNPDTPVLLADGTHKPISSIRRSDLVLATDPVTGSVGPRPVTNVIVGDGLKHLVDVDLSTGQRITATANHPFWVQRQDAFIPAEDLKTGDLLRTSAGTYVQITALTARDQYQRVYNLTIADIHTFHVGADNVLVHNANPICRDAASRLLRVALGGISPYGTYGQAHHIYAFKYHTGPLGAKLTNFGIDLNGAENGIWLPSKEYVGIPSSFAGSYHSGAPKPYYTDFVETYLNAATSKADALSRLNKLKEWLSNGCMPINSLGVRTKPGPGICGQALVDHYRAYGIEIETP